MVLALALAAAVQDLQHHQEREQGQDSHGQDMRQRPQLLELVHGVGGFVRNNSDVSGVILRKSKQLFQVNYENGEPVEYGLGLVWWGFII